ncbi:hypothetical protein ACGFYQ_38890 [Streptomyces sp. NPDC048258]|uniref:hypothetical protein n=1 Tax=Streptomyces sp. NPDC048258 TaxID=3365527 RepID=UPI0037193A79
MLLDGQEKTSTVHYLRPSAEQRQRSLVQSGATAVEIFETTHGRQTTRADHTPAGSGPLSRVDGLGPGGPKAEGTWEAEASAVKRFRGFIGTHGSDDVTITLWAETDGIRRRLRTWTKDHGEVLHAGQ